MKRPTILLLLGTVGLSGVAALFACIQEHARPDVEGGPPAANACDGGGPGNFPSPNCSQSDNSCPGPGSTACPTCGQCPIDASVCGDPSTCLPLADNSKKSVYDFRLRKLFITEPPTLASVVVQTTVIDTGIDLAAPQCGDISGTGAFNWLLRVDPTGATVLTGGAPPSPDPFSVGYCFYNYQIDGLTVSPSMVSASFDGGTFTTSPIPLLNVPVFLHPDAGAANPANVIILPLRQAVLQQTSITNNDNCIGSFNAVALAGNCVVNDPSSCSKWLTAGALGAYMTLEDADSVPLSILPSTLCVLLTGMHGTSPNDAGINTCPRNTDGSISAKGDYCSTTQSAGGCADSFWLSATFAASAVTINDGSGDPTCQGLPDASPDASDASSD
jgi:hypothetical protein